MIRRSLGIALNTNHVYNWWSSNKKPLIVDAFVYNTSEHNAPVEYNYWIRNFSGKVLVEKRKLLDMESKEIIKIPISVNASKRDLLFVQFSAKNRKTGKLFFSRTNLAVLPPYTFRSTEKNSIFGLAAAWPEPTLADSKRLMQRMGVRWLRNGDTRKYRDIGIVANCHRASIPLLMKEPERDRFIKKFLAKCINQHNPYWEVMNEVNLIKGISKRTVAETYVRWLRDIRRIQKDSGMTQVKLMSAGIAGMDKKFIQDFYNAGGWGLVDAIALHPGRGNFTADYGIVHPYNGWEPGAAGNHWNFYGAVRSMKNVINKYGGNKPLWLTEVYAQTQPNSSWADPLHAQAGDVMLEYALAASEGVRVAMFYQLFDTVWTDKFGINKKNSEYFYGLLNRDLSFKSGLMAYCAISEALDQSKFLRPLKFSPSKSRGLLFYSKGHGSFAIMWNRSEGYRLTHKSDHYVSPEPWVSVWKKHVDIRVPSNNSHITLVNSIGQRRKIPVINGVASIEVGGSPVIVYGINAKKMP